MYGFVRQPRWVVLATLVALTTLLFVSLGLWQLRRLEERQLDNAIQAQRRASAPVDITEVVPLDQPTGPAGREHDGRPLVATGEFDPAEEVLLRSRTLNGQAGFHVITPLVVGDSAAVLVNRGWIPLGDDTPPIAGAAAAPEGIVTVTGYGQASSVQPRFGPTDPAGDLDVFARADVDRIAQQTPYDLYPLVLVSSVEAALPVPVTPAPLEEGPHLLYAIQWFSFAVISVGGFAALVRSTGRKRARHRGGSNERATRAAEGERRHR